MRKKRCKWPWWALECRNCFCIYIYIYLFFLFIYIYTYIFTYIWMFLILCRYTIIVALLVFLVLFFFYFPIYLFEETIVFRFSPLPNQSSTISWTAHLPSWIPPTFWCQHIKNGKSTMNESISIENMGIFVVCMLLFLGCNLKSILKVIGKMVVPLGWGPPLIINPYYTPTTMCIYGIYIPFPRAPKGGFKLSQ